MKIVSEIAMIQLGERLGAKLRGGEIIELIGDLGAGKTTLAKGLARGLGITDQIHSPTFTIALNYAARDGLELNHYDFYRLNDPGIMVDEIRESSADPHNVTLIEWGESVRDFLPRERTITIRIDYLPIDGREVNLNIPDKYSYIGKI
ncbi:MAG: tRNA (adenosine(37)-N6)-threonylcarbamoyltransferase complex ATPase subunit type 1 TsaE [Candidatus Nanoperiomorbaceae bacterium]